MLDRNQSLKDNFVSFTLSGDLPSSDITLTPQQAGLSAAEVVDIFESQCMSRHLDLQSRVMQKAGQSFYTIGSSGHEGNAAYAKAFRPSDMAFLHYRSGAFLVSRAKQVPGETPIYDMLLSFAASSEDPISGGRHKVLGSKTLCVPPQTSTIASHLPKAVGAAYSIPLAGRVKHQGEMPDDSVIVCNFGDASSNHSTAQGAINAACWAAYQSMPLPIVFICEDNGIGISTATPQGWVAANFKHRAGLHYIFCDGLNILDTYQKGLEAARVARTLKKPVFLHVRTVRLLGHAGSDAEFTYRSKQQIDDNERQDPLLHTARILIENDILTAQQVVEIYNKIDNQVAQVAKEVVKRPRLETAEQVLESLLPPVDRNNNYAKPLNDVQRAELFNHDKHNLSKPQHLAKLINWTLMDLMAEQQNIVMCGEDIAKKGGVYSVTTKLSEKFSTNRVINTLLDEQSILGLAIGMAHNGFLPIPEIQFLAYVHNAEDQIRGEAATLSFFSNGQYTNPMVIRIAGLAYQKGFGGHFHNDNSFAIFRDIPGVVICCPSNGGDAVELLRSCVKIAQEEKRVVVFLEPIALYMTRDLVEAGDNGWAFDYVPPAQSKPIALGEFGTFGDGKDLCIISYGNGYYLSRQAERQLADKGINCTVVDLRWLSDIDEVALARVADSCDNILIVDECRHTGSISEALVTMLHENCTKAPLVKRITAHDSFIPLGSAAYAVLPSTQEIVDTAVELVGTVVAKKTA